MIDVSTDDYIINSLRDLAERMQSMNLHNVQVRDENRIYQIEVNRVMNTMQIRIDKIEANEARSKALRALRWGVVVAVFPVFGWLLEHWTPFTHFSDWILGER